MPYKDPEKRRAANKVNYLAKVKPARTADGNAAKRLADRAYYERHSSQLNEIARARRADGYYAEYDKNRTPRPTYSKNWFLNQKYGINYAQWEALFEFQGRVCAACGSSSPKRYGKRAGWATDHCHTDGLVRGILCNRCNLALGFLGDTLEALQQSSADPLAYLQSVAIRRACIELNGIQTAPQAACPRKGTSPTQYHYTIVRADLPFGMQVAQVVHAAGESASPRPKPGTHAVALHARDENHIEEIAQRLYDAGIEHHCVFECDDDPQYPGQLMSIGLYPTTDREKVRKVLSSLPLVK